uniref:Uncharacterized protein n=1 Tax=Riboviria sp. TaxID=2585031 RepID=A0A514D2H9_9VIRU|nr:MAG: hypothetical protein H3RhizoLitter1326_000001 [Riboviria sp.]
MSSSSQIALQTVAAGETSSVSSQLLGQAFNPTRRRFFMLVGSLSVGEGMNIAFSPFSGSYKYSLTLGSFVQYVPFAFLESCKIILAPSAGSHFAITGVHAVLSVEDFPKSQDRALDLPSAVNFQIAPAFPGGITLQHEWPVTFDWGVQRQIKPLPMIGGPPRFTINYDTVDLTGQGKGNPHCGRIYCEAIVCIDRSAASYV